jgi:hypothetical protein
MPNTRTWNLYLQSRGDGPLPLQNGGDLRDWYEAHRSHWRMGMQCVSLGGRRENDDILHARAVTPDAFGRDGQNHQLAE